MATTTTTARNLAMRYWLSGLSVSTSAKNARISDTTLRNEIKARGYDLKTRKLLAAKAEVVTTPAPTYTPGSTLNRKQAPRNTKTTRTLAPIPTLDSLVKAAKNRTPARNAELAASVEAERNALLAVPMNARTARWHHEMERKTLVLDSIAMATT